MKSILKSTILCLLMILFSGIANAQFSQSWAAIYDSPNGTSTGEQARDIKNDPSGNTYAAIYTGDIVLVKYNLTGTKLWERTYNGTGNGNDFPNEMALDPSGNIYIAGNTANAAGNSDIILLKYDASGNLIWVRTFNGAYNGIDVGTGIFVSATGNEISVTGYTNVAVGDYDIITIQWDSSGNQLWFNTLSGTQNLQDQGNDIIGDASGNIYTVGNIKNNASQYSGRLIKYNSLGVQQWVAGFTGNLGYGDDAAAIALDPSDNIIVAGSVGNSGTSVDIATAKYTPAGVQSWKKTITSLYINNDYGKDVLVDASSNIYTLGYTNDGTSSTVNLHKYDPLGNDLWGGSYVSGATPVEMEFDLFGNIIYIGKYSSGNQDVFAESVAPVAHTVNWLQPFTGTPASYYDYCMGVSVDGSGNVHLCGQSFYGSSTLQDATIVTWDNSGNFWWSDFWGLTFSTAADAAYDMVRDFNNNIYVVGYTYNNSTTNEDFVTLKYNSSGVKQWASLGNGTSNGYDRGKAIKVDANGNVYTTGYIGNSSGRKDYGTIKYNSSGVEQWKSIYTGTLTTGQDSATAIAYDGSGNVYVTGMASNTTSLGDIATVKYNSVGVQQWVKTYTGTANNNDIGRAIYVDGFGNIYVCGSVQNIGFNNDYVVIKYDAAGTQLWASNYNGTMNLNDYGVAMAVNSSGEVYVTGYAYNTGTMNDIVTVKFDASGVFQWARAYNGTANSNDYGTSITLDPSENIIVCGYVSNTGTGNDYATIKYDPAGTQLWAKEYNGPGGGNDVANSVKSDQSGRIYTTGSSNTQAQTSFFNYASVIYDVDGTALDTLIYLPGYNATCSAVDPSGGLFVSGYSQVNSWLDIHTLGYCTAPTASAGSNVSICSGGSTTLNASGGTSYQWSPTTGLSDPNIANPVASPTTTTTYTCIVTNGACSSSASVTVTVTSSIAVTASTTNSTICSGTSTTLNASGASSYTWNPGGMTGADITVSPTSTTTYTVTGTDGGGCSNTASVTVNVNPVPTVSVSASSSTICNGISNTLTGSGATTYTWMPGSLSGASVSVTPASTTTYTVTGIDGNGCTNTATTTITVNSLPTITASANNSAICVGSSSTLTAGGGLTYIWMPGNLSGSSVSVTPNSTTIYTVTGTNASGCTNTANVTVTVNSLPTISATANNPSVCAGNSSTITASGGNSYAWSPSTGLSGTTGATVTATPSSTTTYTITGTDANGCANTTTATITVNPLPTVSASASSPIICNGTSTTLTGSGAATYTWMPGSMSGSSATVTPSSTTTYAVTGTDGSGCSNTATVTITVNPLPNVNAGADQIVCEGSSVILSGSGATSYTWDNGVNNGIPFTPPAGTNTYTVTGTTGLCSNTDQVVVTVNPLPIVNAGTDQVVCEGSFVTLSGSGAASYSWDNGVTNNAAFVPSLGTITYTVTGTTGSCSNTDQVVVTVNAIPASPVASSNSPVPLNGLLELYASTVSGATYSWTGPNGFTSALQNPTISNATSALDGDYSVTAVINGCESNPSSTTVTVLTAPPDVTISGIVQSETGQPVEGVKIKMTGDVSDSLVTVSDGAYSFTLAQGSSCVITPSKSNDVVTYNGITALDIVLMQRHILNVQLLSSPYKIIAADVNGSQTVTALDIVLVKSLILQNTTSFPGNKLWAFVNSGFVFSDPYNPFPFEQFRTYASASDASDQHFVGVKLGDVNNSWDPGVAKMTSPNMINFFTKDAEVLQGDIISIPVMASSFSNISGMQYTMEWNPNVLSFEGTENGSLSPDFGFRFTDEGKLTILWYTEKLEGTSLHDSDILFYIKMKVVGKQGSSSHFSITGNITKEEVVDNELNTLKISTTDGLIRIVNDNSAVILGQNSPNPFSVSTDIDFYLPCEANVTMTIYDIYGKKIYESNNIYPKGKSLFSWNGKNSEGNDVSQGTYIYYLKTMGYTGVRKMIKIK